MKELFVTYEIANKLKELGFNEVCLGHFMNELSWQIDCTEGSFYFKDKPSNSESEYSILAPLWQQAIDFLKTRKVLVTERWDGWEYGAYDWDDFIYCETKEEAILKAIEICQVV